ncbi:conserved hypothetical protein [Shewanella sediminis HAW-EB3]|uniref:Uncharacterized protein n=1 Tax=Shewanella sediminis (strain HAW-EB3) TaxID=425104 RepID=A8FPS2_SHESH|nr:hypothetical protein [Shewanella sediminis]ABV34845.1 conserved hypothetical protein [Shewanella sediminis HAW-EB3]
MSVIKAFGQQHTKAEFAYLLQGYLSQSAEVCELFTGATNMTTVVNLIAALSYRESDERFAVTSLDTELVFSVLFDGFHLLFIKEVQHGSLNQAEHLILRLTQYYAAKLEADFVPELTDGSRTEQHLELRNKLKQVLIASSQLDDLYLQRRGMQSNMGR